MNWISQYMRDREAELERLTDAIRMISQLIEEARSDARADYSEGVEELVELREEIRSSIDDLGWAEPGEWLDVANHVEKLLSRLRRNLDRTADWFALT
ncbi:MAG: hypothetical protein GF400_02915 [Candidatus Eisenbacteria bacterium]|nr:hypothetical protein [Candidatus Eisenbacteria bacterium]